MGILHRDIKLENVLYENYSKQATVRLIDFGLSRTFDRTSVVGDYARTPYTMSPEAAALSGLKTTKGDRPSEVMTDKTDVWAVGVIAFIMLSGEFPFIKTNTDMKDQSKMAMLKRVSGLLAWIDCVNVLFDTHVACSLIICNDSVASLG